MSITNAGFEFEKSQKKRGLAFLLLLTLLEGVFSFFIYMAVAGKIFSPKPSEAANGVPQLMSYQGRLTDTSGNPLGGTGTLYCFRYSIYDSASGGSKVWPSGTPASSTAVVADGVFNDQIGRVDALNIDFFTTSTLFLNVEVNTVTSTCTGTWESLTPRQQITASGYAMASEDVFGNYIRTVLGTNNKMQVGLGSGSPTVLFNLDWKNSADTLGGACSDNGAMWYNSAMTRALICENGSIQTLSNSSTTIAGVGTNASTPITGGNIVFSNSNGVSFGQNGSTITASVNAGGGGGYALDDFANISWRGFISNVTNITAVSQRPIFVPFVLPGSITWNQMELEVSRATSGSNLFTVQAGIYTYVNGTQISLLGSLQNTYSGTNTGSQSGIRRLIMTGMQSQATTLGPGIYVLGLNFSASAGTASMNYSLRGGQTVGPSVGNIGPGANAYTTASSQLSSLAVQRFLGRYSATTGAFPSSVGFNQVQQYTSGAVAYFHIQST